MRKQVRKRLSVLLIITLMFSVMPTDYAAGTEGITVFAAGTDVYVPLVIESGFNADVVVEAGAQIQGSEITAAVPFDGDNNYANYALFETGLNVGSGIGTGGLPADRVVSFNHDGQDYKYQLAGYNGDNAVQVTKSLGSNSGELKFLTPGAYSKISILGSSGNGDVTCEATVKYADGTNESRTFKAPNWESNVYMNVGRVKIKKLIPADAAVGKFETFFGLYHFEVVTDPQKLVKSIAFTFQSATADIARANLLAVSGMVSGEVPVAPGNLNANDITEEGFTLSWDTVADADYYYVDVSEYSDFREMVSSYNNKKVDGSPLVVEGLDPDTDYYYRVRAGSSSGQSQSLAGSDKATTLAGGGEPTAAPTETPTETPTEAPTVAPTAAPTAAPTVAPTAAPTVSYTITAKAGKGGTISPSGSVSVTNGANRVFKIKANRGYQIAGVTVDGKDIGKKSSYTFRKVAANHSIKASFTAVKRGFKVRLKGNGGSFKNGKKSASVNIARGRKLGKMKTPTRKGHIFLGWFTKKIGGKKVKASTAIKKNMTLYAHWGGRGIVATRRTNLHIRNKSGMDGKIISKYPKSTRLVILGESGNWYRVMIGKRTGWMYKQYVNRVSV